MGGVSYTLKLLNDIKNSQIIKFKSNIELNTNLEWCLFNVNDPRFKDNVTNFIFYNDDRHKKIILGKYDRYSNTLPISYI